MECIYEGDSSLESLSKLREKITEEKIIEIEFEDDPFELPVTLEFYNKNGFRLIDIIFAIVDGFEEIGVDKLQFLEKIYKKHSFQPKGNKFTLSMGT